MNRILLSALAAASCFAASGQKKYPSHTWRQITEDCKIGFVDPEGRIMIKPQYEHASTFSNGRAFVWSYPGLEEDKAQVPLGERYQSYEDINIDGNSRTGIIDSTGRYIVEPKVNFRPVRYFHNGIAYVEQDNEVIIINKKGREIQRYDADGQERDYQNILLVSRVDHKLTEFCYVNPFREIVYGTFEHCEEFSGNYGAVKLDGKYGYIDRSGNLAVLPQFEKAGPFREGYATVSVKTDRSYYGVIDTLGRFVIAPVYDWLGTPSEGLVEYSAEKDSVRVHGFLDLKGKVVIPAQYYNTDAFHEGLAAVSTGENNYGYIDTRGRVVIPMQYDFAGSFQNGTAFVRVSKSKTGTIDRSGKLIWGPVKQQENCD